MRHTFSLTLLMLVCGLAPAQAPVAIPPDLNNYVARTEPDYSWKHEETIESDGNVITRLHLVSQKWHDELWEHDLVIFVPKDTKDKSGVVLLNTGGSAKGNTTLNLLGLEMARRMKTPVAFLFGIPKQPLYGNKREDALIAETFVRFLETKDSTWPLLFPMVKSVVKAMDAIQDYGKKEWKIEVTRFVVTGASKRGWTSWLTAATGDKRVVGIAPMVIDTLNFQKQMPNQLKSFGRYSEMIHDYEERKLLPLPDTADGRRLWSMVDPWVYRERLTLPKLIVNGTNDPYWTQDALNMYWDDLPMNKWIIYVPNAGHNLRPQEQPNTAGTKTDPFPMKAVDATAAFSRIVLAGQKMPNPSWKINANGGFDVSYDRAPLGVKLWTTSSESRDFRRSKWESSEIAVPTTNTFTCKVDADAKKLKAAFVEFQYEFEGLKYHLSTQIQIVEPKK